MPPFPGAAGSTNVVPALCSLAPGDSAYVFGVAPAGQGSSNAIDDTNVLAEEPPAAIPPAYNSASVAIAALSKGPPPMITVDIAFVQSVPSAPSAPGAFEIDIQEADVNCDADFIMPTTNAAYKITAVASALTNRVRVDLSPSWGNFLRLSIQSLTNDVDIIAKISRKA
jgi:hypothetical protein